MASISLPLDDLVSKVSALPDSLISLPLVDSLLTFSYSKSVLIVLPLLDFKAKIVPFKVFFERTVAPLEDSNPSIVFVLTRTIALSIVLMLPSIFTIKVPFSTLVTICSIKLSSTSTSTSVVAPCSTITSTPVLASILVKGASIVLFSVTTFPLPSIPSPKFRLALHEARLRVRNRATNFKVVFMF